MSEDEKDVDAGQGGDAGKSSPEKEAGLLSALQAERSKRHDLERDLAQLKGTVDTLKQTQTQPKQYTRTELQSEVDAGRMSSDAADRLLENQRDQKLKTETKQELTDERRQEEMASRIKAEVDLYRKFEPNIEVDGSEARLLVAEEYNRQVTNLGKPQNMQTELDALAATYGPSSKLQKGRETQAQTHQETGGAGGGDEEVAGNPPKGLSPDAKKYYGKMIENGMYADWAAVEKELSHASQGPKRRLGA